MRLLTLNTHSHLEENYDDKCRIFAHAIARLKPDVIALQEVNQSRDAETCSNMLHIPTEGSLPLKEDNHVLKVTNILATMGIKYFFSYLGFKKGYEKYDEGIALMSASPMSEVKIIQLSKITDYNNWKTRMALAARIDGIYFCSTHLGWWDDNEETFKNQFQNLERELSLYDNVFLMGDFNSPSDEKNKGYDLICTSGWHDTYTTAHQKDGSITTPGSIAGWEKDRTGKRIDYIFSKQKVKVTKSCVLFNGKSEPRVSDHFAVMADIEEVQKCENPEY